MKIKLIALTLLSLTAYSIPVAADEAYVEYCTNFKNVNRCQQNALKCTVRKTSITWAGIVYSVTGKTSFRLCFNKDKCLDGTPTFRSTTEGYYIASTILQNPKKLSDYPTKILATFTWSISHEVPRQVILFGNTGGTDVTPYTDMPTGGDCGMAGKLENSERAKIRSTQE